MAVQVRVGVQATALIARTSSCSISETAARFLDERNSRRVVPDVVALDQEGIDLATNEFDKREGGRRCTGRTRWETGSGRVVQSREPSIANTNVVLIRGASSRPPRVARTTRKRRRLGWPTSSAAAQER